MSNTLPRAIIFDMDGTLTNYAHRAHLLEPAIRNMIAFFDEMEDDTQNDWCRELLDEARERGIKIILLTGRPDSYRGHTERWLKKHGIEDYEVLLMRKADDFRPGAIVKAEIFRKEIEGKYNVLYAVDDNPKILKMWAKLGIRCMYCGLHEHLQSGHDVTP